MFSLFTLPASSSCFIGDSSSRTVFDLSEFVSCKSFVDKEVKTSGPLAIDIASFVQSIVSLRERREY